MNINSAEKVQALIGRSVRDSADQKNLALYEFRFCNILDAMLKMHIAFLDKTITLFKIQKVRPIGLRRRLKEILINLNFTVINVIVCFHNFRTLLK